MGKTRVSDGARTRDNWSHNPSAFKWLRILGSLLWSYATGKNRRDSREPAPGAVWDFYREPHISDDDVLAALTRATPPGDA
jgi:hypothetical protein